MDFSSIDNILNIGPEYLAIFAAILVSIIQTLKGLGGRFEPLGMPLSLVLGQGLAAMIIDYSGTWREDILSILVLGFIISATASGTYSFAKKTETK